MKTYLIGDIHNGYKALKQLITRCPIDLKKDTLIFIGDYIDGWPDAVQTVNYLIELKKKMGDRMITIRGNHDIWLQDWLHTENEPWHWLQNGGPTTLESYKNAGLFKDEKHKQFFLDMVNWYIDDENRIFIHAGWDYTHHSDEFVLQASLPVNAGIGAMECHWDRTLYYSARAGAKSQTPFKATKRFKEVYIGHTATDSHLPEQYGNLWNVDSGAGWSGKLTALDVDSKEYWQSDFVKDLYPECKGR